MFTKQRNTLVLYTTAVCNLNCSYCYIDKNPALQKIDDMLDESFKGDYYFDFTKQLFPDRNQLREVQIWGGEPTLRLDRCFYTIEKLIEYYPSLHSFMFSTNFVGDYWFDMIGNFFAILAKYPKRNFNVNIQLSIDGPPKINDLGRGKDVTKRFLNNFKILTQKVKARDWIPKNVVLTTHFKATLSSTTIPLLQTKEAIIEYYKFFDTCAEMIKFYEYDNFIYNLTLPNTACPSPHTKEEGIMFANLCRLCREVEKENQTEKYFKHYFGITPFASGKDKLHHKNCPYLSDGCGTCGIGINIVGLLPNNRISLCHNGFVDLISDYKQRCMDGKNAENRTIDETLFSRNLDIRDTNCSIDDFQKYQELSESFLPHQSTFQMGNLVIQIRTLAKHGLIDEKYQDLQMAIKGARFIQTTPYCIRDNLGSTGSMIIYPMGLIKLLLNGAREYILNEQDE
jgi:hypothetical protein